MDKVLDQVYNDSTDNLNPLLEKYTKIYEANPLSTVFAPLAETYRKIGRKDKALSILREGIKRHPDYLLGYLGLAQCYFDLEQFNLAYNTLKPLIEKNRENIRLQRLFAIVSEKTNHETDALDAYKYILFLNPKDQESAFKVRKLEDPLLIKLSEKENSKDYKMESLSDFSKIEEEENNWETVSFQKIEILEKLAYYSQKNGEIEKASQFVELSLSINPQDEWAKNKWEELKSYDSLSNKTVDQPNFKAQKIKHKLLDFLEKIKNRSLLVLAKH